MADEIRGRLLVASPSLLDPNFARTVVAVLDHSPEGALGVVLNRPSDVPVLDILPTWHDVAAPPQLVHVGGPVSPSAAICLARAGAVAPATGFAPLPAVEALSGAPAHGSLGTVDLEADPDELAHYLDALRIYAGYAGWAAGQLDAEVDNEDWFVLPAQDSDYFSTDPAQLWSSVLRRQRGALALIATMPLDPRMN